MCGKDQPVKNKAIKTNYGLGILCSVLILLFVSGCVYLRLLAFKNQLKEFDRYFEVEVDQHYTLHFKKPMLYSKDIRYLAKIDASRKEEHSEKKSWTYVFEKVVKDNQLQKEKPLMFTFRFNQKDKLNSISLSPIFLYIVPEDFLTLSFRSLGSAEVDTKKRRVYGDSEVYSEQVLRPPKRDKILKGLGIPGSIETENDQVILKYTYRLVGGDDLGEDQNKGKADVNLNFDPETDELILMKGNFAGMKLSINYEKLIKKSEQVREAVE